MDAGWLERERKEGKNDINKINNTKNDHQLENDWQWQYSVRKQNLHQGGYILYCHIGRDHVCRNEMEDVLDAMNEREREWK